MAKVALTGGAYEARSVIGSAQRSVNLYGEPMPQGQGEPAPMAHYPTPGSTLLSTVGPGPIRGIRQCPTGGIYVVSGSGVYSVNPSTWAGTLLGSISPGITTLVSMQDNGLDLIIVDGTTSGFCLSLSDNSITPIPSSTVMSFVTTGTETITGGWARYTGFTAAMSAVIPSLQVWLSAGYTGNLTCSLFSDAAGRPGDTLGFAVTITNPVAGPNTMTFQTPASVTRGKPYWIGFDSDTTAGYWDVDSAALGFSSATSYASFPASSPTVLAAQGIVCQIALNNDPAGFFAGADRVDYIDTYLLFNKPNTPQFYISGSLSVSFDPLDWANKESYSDLLVTLCVAKREVWLLGQRTTEIWYNAGGTFSTTDPTATGFPFQEVQSVFVDHGCAAKYSVANYDNSVFWLTQDRQGQGFVMMGAGYQTQRVSTYAIEAELAGYATIHDAIGFCYQLAGHTFYVLTFPTADKTWCYDVGTKLWHEWAWIDSNGDEHRHRANCFWPCGDTLVVGDWQNGNLYSLRNDVFTDFGGPIKRVRTYPHLVNDGRRVFYHEFIADIEAGNLGDAETLLSLVWSNDRGHSWGSPVAQSAVSAGQYLTSVQWQRLGMARDRVFEISWTGGGLRALQGAWINAEMGDAQQPAGAAS